MDYRIRSSYPIWAFFAVSLLCCSLLITGVTQDTERTIFCILFCASVFFALKWSDQFKLDLSETLRSSHSASIQPKSKHLQMRWCNIPPPLPPPKYIMGVVFRRCPAGTSVLHSTCIHYGGSHSVCNTFCMLFLSAQEKKLEEKKNEGQPSNVKLFSFSLLQKRLITCFCFWKDF